MSFTDYTTLDQKVCMLAGAIETNILSFTNPQNLEEEKTKFFNALKKNEQYNPKFSYVPRNPLYSYFQISPNFNTYKNELKELLDEMNTDDNSSLSLIFERKILDLFDRMELIRSVGTQNFSGNSESYYGAVDNVTLKYAKEFLQKKFEEEKQTIGFIELKKTIEAFLKKKKLNYKVVEREGNTTSKFSVNIRTKEVLLNKEVTLSENSLKRLIAHEIEGHIYRYENGLNQPYLLFARGLSKETIETEEGIAVVVEKESGINVDAQLKDYSGRILAIDTATKKSFYETFEEMRKYFNEEEAFNLTLRAKRGTWKQDQGGAFTKDVSYLKGMLAVEDFLKEQKLTELYYGRYGINDTPLVLAVDGLKKPKYLPEFLKK
ncbi:MAG: tyrosine/phenylalanine carboxypeptidase domain-containing protein [archaeon]|jgi:uncharacterized protein (TIGR02421 family)